MSAAFLTCTPLALRAATVRSPERRRADGRRARPSATPRRRARMSASSKPSDIVQGPFDGMYGAWYLTRADVTDVRVYRAALAVMCAAQSAGIALAVWQPSAPPYVHDALFALGTGAFGVALTKIHIYVKPLHDALKLLWAAGLVGAAAILASQHQLVPLVYARPALLLATGWQFVALTGVFVKEAFCFARLEAVALALLTPLLVGGHFLAILPNSVERAGALLFAASFVYFCASKLTQDVTDDIGDMSVFQHRAKSKQAPQ